MPQVESRVERIMATVRDQLASIVAGATNPRGWTFWITPKAVLRVDSFTDALLSTPGYSTVYVLVPDIERREPATTFQISDNTLEFFAYLLTEHRPKGLGDSENPFSPEIPLRDTLRNRMAADVKARLEEPVSFGAVYPGLEVYDVRVVEVDRQLEPPDFSGWARAIQRVVIKYRSRPESP